MNTPSQSTLKSSFSLQPAELLFPVVVTILILAMRLGLSVQAPIVLGLLVAGVVLAGLPHGALDPLVARRLFAVDRRFTMIRFLLVYLFLSFACVLGWLAAPNIALTVFLIVSAFHFGSDLQGRGYGWGQTAYGVCVISISSLRYAPDVRQIFAALGATASAGIVNGLKIAAVVAILVAIVSLLRRRERRWLDAIELATIILGGLALPPLIFFICYFCLLHSPRHLLTTARLLDLHGAWQILRTVAPVVLATVGFATLLWRFLPSAAASGRLLEIIFIGLAALTAPHMLLTTLSERKEALGTHAPAELA